MDGHEPSVCAEEGDVREKKERALGWQEPSQKMSSNLNFRKPEGKGKEVTQTVETYEEWRSTELRVPGPIVTVSVI